MILRMSRWSWGDDRDMALPVLSVSYQPRQCTMSTPETKHKGTFEWGMYVMLLLRRRDCYTSTSLRVMCAHSARSGLSLKISVNPKRSQSDCVSGLTVHVEHCSFLREVRLTRSQVDAEVPALVHSLRPQHAQTKDIAPGVLVFFATSNPLCLLCLMHSPPPNPIKDHV